MGMSHAYLLLPSPVSKTCTHSTLQEHAQDELQKYKEGKFIIESRRVIKVWDAGVACEERVS